MHIVILYAGAESQAFQQAIAPLPLPNLTGLLRGLRAAPGGTQLIAGGSYCPLPELVEARALALLQAGPEPVKDGLLPWAAREARHLRLPTPAADEGWAWITPCHWQVNADHVVMHDPSLLNLSPEESGTLMEAMRRFFEEDGMRLYPTADAGRWLACGKPLHQLPTASLDRVRGLAVDAWLPEAPALRRLQNEMQMLLYTHPVNDARAAQGLQPVNAFWISGTGPLPMQWQAPADVVVLPDLRQPALLGDAQAWAKAWAQLDQHLGERVEAPNQSPLQITLCGERRAQTFTVQQPGFWQRFSNLFQAPAPLADLLKTL